MNHSERTEKPVEDHSDEYVSIDSSKGEESRNAEEKERLSPGATENQPPRPVRKLTLEKGEIWYHGHGDEEILSTTGRAEEDVESSSSGEETDSEQVIEIVEEVTVMRRRARDLPVIPRKRGYAKPADRTTMTKHMRTCAHHDDARVRTHMNTRARQ